MQRFLSYAQQHLQDHFSQREINTLAHLLLRDIASLDSVQIYSRKDIIFPAETEQKLREAVDRIAKHEPVQYVLGTAEFMGRTFNVGPGVLIPRPETEELVDRILKDREELPGGRSPRVLDLGTGSGCIAISLAAAMPQAEVTAWDLSEAALSYATLNNSLHHTSVRFEQRDMLSYLPDAAQEARFDILVSNPPYVMEKEKHTMEANVLDFEPSLALFVDDTDPLLFYRAISRLAVRLLTPGGALYVEINEALGRETQALMEAASLEAVRIHTDLSGKDRMIRALQKRP
jgi:release factor glutamine methyltransferase